MRFRILVMVLAALLVSAAAEAAAQQVLRPLVIGWEQWFRLDWQPGERGGKPMVHGRIYNTSGKGVAQVRLLVDELDATGNVTSQTIGWLPMQLTPGTTAPFEVPVAHATPNYRVSVFAFDWIERGRGGNR